jgi:hypothetical protein
MNTKDWESRGLELAQLSLIEGITDLVIGRPVRRIGRPVQGIGRPIRRIGLHTGISDSDYDKIYNTARGTDMRDCGA